MQPATIFTRWNADTRRNERVPAGTPGAIEWLWSTAIGRYVTIPRD